MREMKCSEIAFPERDSSGWTEAGWGVPVAKWLPTTGRLELFFFLQMSYIIYVIRSYTPSRNGTCYRG